MSNVIAFNRLPDDDAYDRIADRHNAVLEEESQVFAELRAIQARFVKGDLTVKSGPRKGQPLMRSGLTRLWGEIESLMWRQARLLDERSRLHRLATGWRPASSREAGGTA